MNVLILVRTAAAQMQHVLILLEAITVPVTKNVCCVVMSVRVSVMCCGSVQHIF